MAVGGPAEDAPVDPRYTLANERTLLAWARTALAFIAAGLAVVQLLDQFGRADARRAFGVGLILLGSVVALLSGRQWQRRDTAMRAGRPIPPSRLGWLIAGGTFVVGVIAAVFAAGR